MPWQPSEPNEFPTLGQEVATWIEENLVVPDGPFVNDRFVLSDWQYEFLLWFYRLRPNAVVDLRKPSRAFAYDRGGQLVMPKKIGKGPFSAAVAIAEAAGPVLFDGWNADGKPVGRPWPTPWIEITAVSEDQAGNVWRALLPMIREGSISADIPDTGETRINLQGGGVIKPVTSSARSRSGGRVTFAVEDETQDWWPNNGGRKLANAQRDNLAGMGGRFLDTANAWDPTRDSVAEATFVKGTNVYKMKADAGTGDIKKKRERMVCLNRVYEGSPWVDLERVSSEIDEHVALGSPAEAERLFLNRIVPGEGHAFDPPSWEACGAVPYEPVGTCAAHPRENAFHERSCGRPLITIGIDGARYIDALAVIATEVATSYQWPLGIWERPPGAPDTYEHPLDEVDGTIQEAFDRFNIWRVYVDPGSHAGNISHLVERWQGRWTDKRVQEWRMSRPRAAAEMVRRYAAAIEAGDVQHPRDPVFTRHIENARRRALPIKDEEGRPLWLLSKAAGTAQSIDAAAAGALSWEARGDAEADGTLHQAQSNYEDQLCKCAKTPGPPGGHLWNARSCAPQTR